MGFDDEEYLSHWCLSDRWVCVRCSIRKYRIGALTNYLNERDEVNIHGKPLIKLLNLDRLNSQMDAQSDGVFDFIEGVTVKSSNGRIIFPVREPFGNYCKSVF